MDAEWQDRGYQSAVLDAKGRLMVMAGLIYPNPPAWISVNGQQPPSIPIPSHAHTGLPLIPLPPCLCADVWRSTISFHDLDAVSAACNVTIPACGAGLRCYPDVGTVVAAHGSFVAWAACLHPSLLSPHPPSQHSPGPRPPRC